jgi:hypothetical protein
MREAVFHWLALPHKARDSLLLNITQGDGVLERKSSFDNLKVLITQGDRQSIIGYHTMQETVFCFLLVTTQEAAFY